ncbi:MAG: rod shape-determining protein MreC [Acidimicrobiaceae bacterium]|nr:rod shape-determining protein MreC [Acidimicrobiaceae bacterium]MXZ99915.1 rod shape-determining protein MreC [Acidimicrobiaceae bacterium]MYE98445.1 rod shape-determining protein MreC [Acidimicrobiaceae bacterium]MYH44389.1 rod shape-determining protein MreC [Acidimicrobiaceae bacterium]MYI52543.1 rod shape-determining protein MreC [Acidimicrobiaceae bacterium]
MAVAQRSGRSRYRLLLLILTAATLLTLDFRGFGPLDAAQSRVRDALEPVVSAVDAALGPVAEVWTAMFTYNDLRAENERLRDEVDRLASADIRGAAERDALERLLDATGVTFVEGVERLTATVLRDSAGNFDDDVMSIDVGHREGVAPGMAVVTSAGFVGRVETVDAASSTVTAVSDPSLVVGVRLLDSGDVGLGHGMAGDPTKFVVDAGVRWPETGDLSELPAVGSPVVTAAGSRYPADIPVGRVASVEPSEAGLAQLVTVDLAADVQDLGYVTVLLLTPTDEAPVGPDSPFSEPSP